MPPGRQQSLTVPYRSADLGFISDRQDSDIGVKELQQIFSFRDDVSTRFAVGRCCVDELARVKSLGVGKSLDVLADGISEQLAELSDRERDPMTGVAVMMTCDESVETPEGGDRDRHRTSNSHILQICAVDRADWGQNKRVRTERGLKGEEASYSHGDENASC